MALKVVPEDFAPPIATGTFAPRRLYWSKIRESALKFIYTMLWACDGWCSDGQAFAQTQKVGPLETRLAACFEQSV